jgi:hypothetical protein
MSTQKPKKYYVYRSTGGDWSKAGIPSDRNNIQQRIANEQSYAEQVRLSSQTGRIPSGGRKVYWAVIEVDGDVEPAETMTHDEMRAQNIFKTNA